MSTSLLNAPTGLQARVINLVEQNWFGHFILALILINAVQLGMETSASLMAQYGTLLMSLAKLLLSVFVVELLLRIYAYRGKFFKDPWSVFDFTVIVIALIPASGPLAVLRSLRVLRVLRVLTIVPSMKRVVSALLGSLPGLASIATVLLLIYYVFAVIATKIFGDAFPEWFGTIADSFYTLFQIMTLESWSMGISRPVMEVYPYAWVFFVPFILVATFTMLNLFIAIIVNTMQTFSDEEHALEREQDKQILEQEQRQMHEELKAIRLELQQLQTLLRNAAGDSSNVSTKGNIGSDYPYDVPDYADIEGRGSLLTCGDVEENPGPASMVSKGEAVIKEFMRFKVHMEGSMNGHEFEIEGEGEGRPYEGTQTAKLKVTKGGPLPFSWDILSPQFMYGSRAFTKHPADIPDYYKQSFPEGFKWERVMNFEDGGAVTVTQDTSLEDGTLIYKVKLRGTNFPPDGPVMQKKTMGWEASTERLYPEDGVLKGDIKMALRLKDGGRYLADFKTTYKAKKPVQMPGAYNVDRKLDITSHNEDYTVVEQYERSEGRHSTGGMDELYK